MEPSFSSTQGKFVNSQCSRLRIFFPILSPLITTVAASHWLTETCSTFAMARSQLSNPSKLGLAFPKKLKVCFKSESLFTNEQPCCQSVFLVLIIIFSQRAHLDKKRISFSLTEIHRRLPRRTIHRRSRQDRHIGLPEETSTNLCRDQTTERQTCCAVSIPSS